MSQPRATPPALAAWTALRASGTPDGALVTLVRADGGASRALGMHLALARDGRAFGSVTVGGCADGRALQAAARVIETGTSERLTLPLSEADAIALGLGCAGDVDLLVERVSLGGADPVAAAFDAALDAVTRGARAVLATPLSRGAMGRLLVHVGGEAAGGTGDPARDAQGLALAGTLLQAGEDTPAIHEVDGASWFLQPLAPARTLLIVGATEIAAALCAFAPTLGWRTVLLDPRDAVLAEPRFATATERIASLPAEQVATRIHGPDAPAVIVVAHDYRVELPVLRAALAGRSAYVGMLGSRTRGATMRRMLAEDGLGDAQVQRLRTPIGLAIGARGPAEIAVSIVAEVIAAWRGAAIA